MERKSELITIKETVTEDNIRELFDYRMATQMLSAFTLMELDIKNDTALEKLKIFLKNRFQNYKLYYAIDDGNIILYKIKHKDFKENNDYTDKQLKRIKEVVKNFPEINMITDEVNNKVKFNIAKGKRQTLEYAIKRYCSFHSKRGKHKDEELIVNLIEKTTGFGYVINLLEKNKHIEAVINFIENKYPIKDTNGQDVYWKNLPLKYKVNILKVECNFSLV